MEPAGETEVVAFCSAIRPRLIGALALQLGEPALAEELAQETLARVWERWPSVRQADRPEAWAFRVAFNLARSAIRRKVAERRAQVRSSVVTWHEPDVAEVVALRSALAELPPRQRAAIVLRHLVDLTADDAAVVLGCTPATVRSLSSQGIAKLRVRLGVDNDHQDEEATRA